MGTPTEKETQELLAPLEHATPTTPTPWITNYIMAWIGSYACYATLMVWVADWDNPAKPANMDALQRLVWHGIVNLGPWLIGMAVGVVPALIALMAAWRTPSRVKVFFWTDLIAGGLVALVLLYGSWYGKQLDSRASLQRESEEQVVLRKIIELRDRYAEKARTDQLHTLAQITKLDVPSMISPSNLITDAGIARNRVKLSELTNLVERRASLSQENMASLKRDIGETVAGHVPSSKVQTWLAAATKERAKLEDQIYETQRSFISVLSELNEFMGARVGRVVVQEGVMRFPTEQEAHRYNAYMQKTMRLAQLESELLAKYEQVIERGVTTLESLRR